MTDSGGIALTINGEACSARAGSTVASLLADLRVDAARVVVERNGEVLERSRFATVAVAEGDRLEVVRFVGGG